MLRCVDVYAIMPDNTRRLSFTGSVRTMIDRHWAKVKPREEDIIDDLSEEPISIPMIFPDREKYVWEKDDWCRGLFYPKPVGYVAIGRFD